MKKSFHIFQRDLSRLLHNKAAILVLIGVCLLPSLYAWFNIAANLDPYGNTSKIKVAIACLDKEASSENLSINAGKEIVKNLKENKQLGWTFTSEKEALNGVKSGKYYASIVIPEDFSRSLISILSGDLQTPKLDYYINEKANAIAPKITGTGAAAIQEQINSTFSSVASESVSGILKQSASDLSSTLDAYSTDADAAFTSLNAVSNRIQTVIDGYTSLADSLTAIKNANPNLSLVIDPILKQISTAVEHQTNLKAELDNAGIKITGAVQNADSLKTEIDGLIKESLTSTSEVKDSYEATVKNQLENLAGSLGSTGSSVSALLTQLNEGASDLTDITNSASDDLALIHTSLSDSSTLLSNVSEQLSSASEALLNPNRDGLSVLTDLLAQKPEAIAAFLASPVSLSEHPVYPIENYGSAMAPFYSTLAMLKVNVSGKALTGVFNPKPHETYIGRSLLFIAIGLLQSSLICLGDLFYLNIQCQHPVYFLFAGWFTSIVYVSIIYALTVSFGDIGKAVCVVLLVMQVAGSGGTFPIEVAPDFFQKVYPLLPFTHSMNAMRECIAGFYSTVYWKELGTLALFLIPALLLGLLLRKPVIRLNDAFTEKLESTKLI